MESAEIKKPRHTRKVSLGFGATDSAQIALREPLFGFSDPTSQGHLAS
jgi:hypothetical protein